MLQVIKCHVFKHHIKSLPKVLTQMCVICVLINVEEVIVVKQMLRFIFTYYQDFL